MENNMTIDEWKDDFLKSLEEFVKHQKENETKSMWGSDWDDQFRMYLGWDYQP